MKTNAHGSGYTLEKVYVAEQQYRLIPGVELPESADSEDRNVDFGWDWRPVSSRRFEVVIEVNVAPAASVPEQMSVRLMGVFKAEDGPLSIAFADFLQGNAPAILFPFAREVISTMSGRGPYGAFHLNPLNVRALLSDFDISQTTGVEFLNSRPDLAADFGLDFTKTALPSAPAI